MRMKNERPAGYIDSGHPNRKFYTCYNCEKPFWKPDAFRKLYCCPECQKEAYKKKHPKKIKPPKEIYKRYCKWCGAEFETMINNQKYCCHDCTYQANLKQKRDEWASAYIPRTFICKECGCEFTTECGDQHSVFCCHSCAEKHERRMEHGTKRHHIYMNKFKRKREKLLSKFKETDVDYEALYKKDHGVCQICGLPVHPEKGVDNNWDGTIDHIVPLSLGGDHMLSNCQLAHRICNSIISQIKNKGNYNVSLMIGMKLPNF